jgi:hypothetical protein
MNIPKADAESFYELTPTKAKELGILWEDWSEKSVFLSDFHGFSQRKNWKIPHIGVFQGSRYRVSMGISVFLNGSRKEYRDNRPDRLFCKLLISRLL